jgi:hypothetical protein
LIVSLLSEIKVHLLSLKALSKYFPDISHKPFPLVTFTFTFYVDEIPEIAQEEFIEMKNDAAINNFFVFGSTFWIRRLLDYPVLSKIVLKILLPFPGTYECEVRFQLTSNTKVYSALKAIFDVFFVQLVRGSRDLP